MIQPDELKTVLQELANMAWEQTPEGHYSLRNSVHDNNEATQSFAEVFNQCNDLTQSRLGVRLAGFSGKAVDMPSDEELEQNKNTAFSTIEKETGHMRISNLSKLSDSGDNSIIMKAESTEMGLNGILRVASISRAENERPTCPNIVQAYYTSHFDADGNPVAPDTNNAIKMEFLPEVPLVIKDPAAKAENPDIKDLVDKLPNRTDEQKEEIRGALYQAYLANIPEQYICNDPGQRHDLAIMPDGSLVNTDGGAISEISSLKKRKYLQIMESNNAYHEYSDGMEKYKGIGAPTYNTQKMIVPASKHEELGLKTKIEDMTIGKIEISKPKTPTVAIPKMEVAYQL